MVLVWNINETIYICLSHIVPRGEIRIFDEKKKNIVSQSFENSNYEKVRMKQGKGNLTVRVSFDNETHTKQVWI